MILNYIYTINHNKVLVKNIKIVGKLKNLMNKVVKELKLIDVGECSHQFVAGKINRFIYMWFMNWR